MVSFPIFEQLDIVNYGMFPGGSDIQGLHISFSPGLTMILGANGLGKTTLVTILYRMCTGPFEISGLSGASALGNTNLQASKLSFRDRRVFANRVADGARNAYASLEFSLGTNHVRVVRRLDTLEIMELKLNGENEEASDESFNSVIRSCSGLPNLGDWILILRYLVFYFEDRRALIWDPTAQRQILRLLLLPSESSISWAESERRVLELDSRVRNLQAALNREEQLESRAQVKLKVGHTVQEQLNEERGIYQTQIQRFEFLDELLPSAESSREEWRLRSLRSEQDVDSVRRELERLQLNHIASAYPSGNVTARYLATSIISSNECMTCGNDVPEFAQLLSHRIEQLKCVMCGSDVRDPDQVDLISEQDFEDFENRLLKLEVAFEEASLRRTEVEKEFDDVMGEYSSLRMTIAQSRARISQLIQLLPPNEQSLQKQAAEISQLRGRLASLKENLEEARKKFEDQVREDMEVIVTYRDDIVREFRDYARDFLFEPSELRWAPHSARVGQLGPLVDFPAFEFEMAGSDFPTPVARTGPDQVSESQREFVDLAFRMALTKIASESRVGSLVIDAPESSLDAVFSKRAAAVLVRFANPELQNRVLVTSNLVDGQLIPKMLADAGILSSSDSRLVDLLRIATPTSATRLLAEEYREVMENLFAPQGMAE